MKTMSVRQGPWDLGGGVELFQWDKSVGETIRRSSSTPCSQRIHVWYIDLHLVDFCGKCRYIYQSHESYGLFGGMRNERLVGDLSSF